jgi:hypothetical protein
MKKTAEYVKPVVEKSQPKGMHAYLYKVEKARAMKEELKAKE